MANRIYIDQFLNETNNLRGYLFHDDYDSCFEHIFDEVQPAEDNLEFFKQILEQPDGIHSSLREALEFCYEHEEGIHIREQYYEFEQWVPLYEKAKEMWCL